jgi:hypothetical protein
MIRKIAILVAVMAAVALTSSAVLAANPHIVGPLSGPITVGNEVTFSGKIAGLGNVGAGALVTGTANLTFDVNCSNPQGKFAGGHQGINAPAVPGSGSLSADSNGNYTFTITFTIGSLEPAKDYGCPNNKWTANPVNVSGTLTALYVNGEPIGL